MSDITGLTGYAQATSYDTYNKSVSELKNKLNNTDYSNANDEELMEACKTFESYFIEQAFKGIAKMLYEQMKRNYNND